MAVRNGFTLMESLFMTLILVMGLAAIASAFSYGALTIGRTRRQTTAIALLTTKMEALRAAKERAPGFESEYFSTTTDSGTVPAPPEKAMFLRTSQITLENPQRITVIVFGKEAGPRRYYRELARASTRIGRGF